MLSGHELVREKRDNLRVGHLIVVVRVDDLEKAIDALFNLLSLIEKHIHVGYQSSELVLVNHPVAIVVNLPKERVELSEESLVLLELVA